MTYDEADRLISARIARFREEESERHVVRMAALRGEVYPLYGALHATALPSAIAHDPDTHAHTFLALVESIIRERGWPRESEDSRRRAVGLARERRPELWPGSRDAEAIIRRPQTSASLPHVATEHRPQRLGEAAAEAFARHCAERGIVGHDGRSAEAVRWAKRNLEALPAYGDPIRHRERVAEAVRCRESGAPDYEAMAEQIAKELHLGSIHDNFQARQRAFYELATRHPEITRSYGSRATPVAHARFLERPEPAPVTGISLSEAVGTIAKERGLDLHDQPSRSQAAAIAAADPRFKGLFVQEYGGRAVA